MFILFVVSAIVFSISTTHILDTNDPEDSTNSPPSSNQLQNHQMPSTSATENCKWGKNCTMLDDPNHCAKYTHEPANNNVSNTSSNETPHNSSSTTKYPQPSQLTPSKPLDKGNNVNVDTTALENCKWGANCSNLDDAEHCAKYKHPNVLNEVKNVASNLNSANTFNVNNNASPNAKVTNAVALNTTQLIACKYGVDCKDIVDSQHCSKYIHPLVQCPNGYDCEDLKIVNHVKQYIHPCKWGQKCKHISKDGQNEDLDHIRHFWHVCERGNFIKKWYFFGLFLTILRKKALIANTHRIQITSKGDVISVQIKIVSL